MGIRRIEGFQKGSPLTELPVARVTISLGSILGLRKLWKYT